LKPIVVNADRPALEINRGGVVSKWEYDVLTIKLELDRLEQLHQLIVDDKTRLTPTIKFLEELSSFLASHGLEGCTVDIALRMHSLIKVQFRQLAQSIALQVSMELPA